MRLIDIRRLKENGLLQYRFFFMHINNLFLSCDRATNSVKHLTMLKIEKNIKFTVLKI